MKRFLVVLTVLALLASSVFAAVTTVTKENSQAGYDGRLTKGSTTGTSTFISDLPLLANTVLFEYVDSSMYGMVVLKTDMGTMGISVSPAPYIYANSISVSSPSDILGLQYATTMSDMTLAGALLFGLDTYNYENKNIPVYNVTNDKINNGGSYIALKLGAAMKDSLDLGLGVSMANYGGETKQYDTPSNILRSDVKAEDSKLGIDLAGRMGLGNMLTAVLGAKYNMGTEKDTTLTYNAAGTKTGDSVVTQTNNYIMIGALIGKDIKATDTLTVKISSGIELDMDQTAQTVTENKMPGGVKTYTPATRWSQAYITVPLNVAIEGKLNETWSINAGTSALVVSSNNNSYKANKDATNEKEDFADRNTESWLNISPSLGYAIGVTGKIGDLTIDLNMNPEILLLGPNFISGANIENDSWSGNRMAMDMALSYNW